MGGLTDVTFVGYLNPSARLSDFFLRGLLNASWTEPAVAVTALRTRAHAFVRPYRSRVATLVTTVRINETLEITRQWVWASAIEWIYYITLSLWCEPNPWL